MENEKDYQSMLAVLIDAENAQPSVTEALMAEIAKFGIASVKRIYGDWTTSHLSGWKSIVLEYSIQPIQQFRYTVGKNATDSAMIIDAMDLLYTQRFNGFCLVSSDSDFTRLASRIREEGLSVYGFGEKKTPQAFVSACDKFIYTEVLRSEGYESSPDQARNTNDLKGDAKLVNILRRAVNATSDESGWALLSSVGASIAKQAPEFDPRNYGYTKLSELVSAIQLFEIDKRRVSESHSKIIYIRDQRKNRKEGLEQPTPVSMAHWARFIAKHKEGDVLQGTIGHIHFLGLFINLADLELTGLIHKSNLPDHFMTSFAVGQKLSVTIKEIRTDKHQIELLYRA